MTTVPSGIETLTPDQCMQLLHETPVGRIVFTSDALPVIRPVPYVVVKDTIIIRIDSGATLSMAGRRDVVAFEIDDIDPVTGIGWSVVVTGHAVEATTTPELEELTLLGWAVDGPSRFITISCDLLSGLRVVTTGAGIRPASTTSQADGETVQNDGA